MVARCLARQHPAAFAEHQKSRLDVCAEGNGQVVRLAHLHGEPCMRQARHRSAYREHLDAFAETGEVRARSVGSSAASSRAQCESGSQTSRTNHLLSTGHRDFSNQPNVVWDSNAIILFVDPRAQDGKDAEIADC